MSALIALFIFFNLLFLLALKLKNNSIVDVGWGIGFIIISFSLIIKQDGFHSVRQVLITSLVFLWASRLSGYIFWRNKGKGEDFRYANWRKEWGQTVVWRSYLQVFMLQMFFLAIIAVPIFKAFQGVAPLSTINIVGIVIAIIGLVFETISDWQMLQFKKQEQNKNQIMCYGLWRYSRHPNYFGEALFWWGIALISLSCLSLEVLISPLVLTYLLRYVSGVPMLEAKYKNHKQFALYCKKTSPLIPWLPKE